MNTLILATAIVSLAAAGQLPSATYLPSAASGQHSGGAGNGNPNYGSGSGGQGGNGNSRPQQAADAGAAILKYNNDADENGFHFSFETSNGIQAEEVGNSVQTRGGFAYKGDDGQQYSVTFTAGEDGFRPEGAHLPVPPPTPEEILLALQQNERDEAAGIFDDGQYHPENNGNQGSQQSSGQDFGSNNHQGGFNSNSGYTY